ncbi:MAG: AraC family transcriptional regulator, partial [Puniceicoccaceae bacterium]
MEVQQDTRPDGFAGQHLVVVPESILGKTVEHPLLRSLLVTDAGYFPRASGHEMRRPQGAAAAILILGREGRGWLELGTEPRRTIHPGEVILIAAGVPHH